MLRFHIPKFVCVVGLSLSVLCGPGAAQDDPDILQAEPDVLREDPDARQDETNAPRYRTGLIPVDEETYRSIPLAETPEGRKLPTALDLSPWFPPPGDQGNQGSCVGFAVSYSLKSYHEKIEHNWGLNTNDHLYSPAYIFNQIRDQKADCLKGSSYVNAFNLLQREGVVSLTDFAYNPATCTALPSAQLKQRARRFAITKWWRVDFKNTSVIKLWTAIYRPVAVAIYVDDNFMNLKAGQVYKSLNASQTDDLPEGKKDAHAVVVVGYSDAKRAFKVINSWGTTWGDGGYGWIDYEAFKRIAFEGYVTSDGPSPMSVPQDDAVSVLEAPVYGDSSRDDVGSVDGFASEERDAAASPDASATDGTPSSSDTSGSDGFIQPEK